MKFSALVLLSSVLGFPASMASGMPACEPNFNKWETALLTYGERASLTTNQALLVLERLRESNSVEGVVRNLNRGSVFAIEIAATSSEGNAASLRRMIGQSGMAFDEQQQTPNTIGFFRKRWRIVCTGKTSLRELFRVLAARPVHEVTFLR